MKSITILIDKTSRILIRSEGFDGQTCKDATKALEQGLGVVLSDKPTFDQGASHSVVEAQQ